MGFPMQPMPAACERIAKKSPQLGLILYLLRRGVVIPSCWDVLFELHTVTYQAFGSYKTYATWMLSLGNTSEDIMTLLLGIPQRGCASCNLSGKPALREVGFGRICWNSSAFSQAEIGTPEQGRHDSDTYIHANWCVLNHIILN